MNFEMIWEKIKELAIVFYNFAMTQGESRFMLVDMDLMNSNEVPEEAAYFFIGSFIVMVLLAVFACDRFELFHPIEGMKEWKSKISIVKVIIFTAAVFSFHTFYKMIVALFGKYIEADASLRTLDCLGSYINPIAIMIYAFAISTLEFRRRWFQAIMLGWALFLTPSAMSFYGFTNEHIAIYATAGAVGLVGGILYKRCSPYVSSFVLFIVYFIAKFFMIFYSDQVKLITAETWFGKIKQYFACIEVDLILALLFLLVMFGYKAATTENINIVKNLVLSGVFLAFVVFSVIAGRSELRYQSDYENAVKLMNANKYEDAMYAFRALNSYDDSTTLANQCEEKAYYPTYQSALQKMDAKDYEGAMELFNDILNYKDSSSKVDECNSMYKQTMSVQLLADLSGIWNGSQGSMFELKEDGTCYYIDGGSGEGEGSWRVEIEEDKTMFYATPSSLGYEVYGIISNGSETTSIVVKSNTSSWRDEEFIR